jgi:hypothetical protein
MNLIDKSLELRQDVRRFVLGWVHPRTLALEKARKDLNAELKDHWKPDSIDVFELILEVWESDNLNGSVAVKGAEDNRFIVFIDQELDVDWITKSNEQDLEAKHSISFAESIGAKRCKHLPLDQVLEFRRLIGQAIASGIQGETDYSRKLSEEAAQFLKDRTVELSRSWTLTAAHVLLLFLSVGLALSCEVLESYHYGQTLDLVFLWCAIQGGLVGAYLSLVQRAGRGEWDAAAGRRIHNIEVFTKLFAGGVLGGIAYALSRSANAPPSLKGMAPDGCSAFLFGVAAGWFERMIPRIISNYSNFETQKQKAKS